MSRWHSTQTPRNSPQFLCQSRLIEGKTVSSIEALGMRKALHFLAPGLPNSGRAFICPPSVFASTAKRSRALAHQLRISQVDQRATDVVPLLQQLEIQVGRVRDGRQPDFSTPTNCCAQTTITDSKS